MALYEVVLNAQYANQQIVNRWNYVSTGTPGTVTGAFGLISAMGFLPEGTPPLYDPTKIFTKLGLLQSSLCRYIQVLAKNIYDPLDFYALPLPNSSTGQNAGEGESPTVAYGFRTSLVRLDIARGMKRFVGVVEPDVDALGVINSTGLGKMVTLADEMSAQLEYADEGSSLSFSPCVVKKLKYTTPRGKTAYKYYPTLTDQSAHLAVGISWQPYGQTRTQTSRQYGRGS